MESRADSKLLHALNTALGTEEEKSNLVVTLVQAWYVKVLSVTIDRLNNDEQTELEQLLAENPDFDPVSWVLERHPEWESIILQELGYVMAELAAEIGIQAE